MLESIPKLQEISGEAVAGIADIVLTTCSTGILTIVIMGDYIHKHDQERVENCAESVGNDESRGGVRQVANKLQTFVNVRVSVLRV
jgi:uncharacterized protein YcgI (DUF1989 family)